MGTAGHQSGKAKQIAQEQHAVDEMYLRLDADLDQKSIARQQALTRRVTGAEELHMRDLDVSRLGHAISQLRAAESSLCFGRIDGIKDNQRLHIGRIGIRTEEGEILLVDWRAEAARPFYAATLATPVGVRRRRHLRTDGRVVTDVSDEILDGSEPGADDIVGDGPLVAVLSGARTGRMRQAAATLQAEQDEIIRSAHRGVMVVDGGPGTGKTIVALHRAAYVLYAFEATAQRGVLVFGPNERFLTYISDVLPSLGENDVQMTTMSGLAGVRVTQTESPAIARWKGQLERADDLANWVQSRQPHGVPLTLRTTQDTVTLDANVVDAARQTAKQGSVGHNRARELFAEYVVSELVNELERRTENELAEYDEEIEAMLGIDLDRAVAKDIDRIGPTDGTATGVDIDWDQVREDLLEDRGIDRAIERVWPRLSAEDVVREFLADVPPESSPAAPTQPDDSAGGGWSDADLALIDEARALIDGPPTATYGHVVVDEAQQLTQMQWRALMRRCPSRSMTVVGDLAQAGPATTIGSWFDALGPFVAERFEHHTLTINYRTTAEILESTRPLLAQIAPEQQVSRSLRHGEPPRAVTTTTPTAAIRDLIGELMGQYPDELIGVIAADDAAPELADAVREPSAVLVAASEARGLEFDTAIIIDPAGIQSANEAGLRDLYVAQTRATKRLITLNT
ncbi:HelD family protein [Cumulibacter soli]|uniref:HelD family protein n=1 Tax=Cumulibacter soli TaxID=2546344 RepID=UPI001ABAE80C|nr:AAA family ATPase [Cumulibacter soli]